jgi:signal transduction histidine kinase/ligand-binding sensor domain-containing protein
MCDDDEVARRRPLRQAAALVTALVAVCAILITGIAVAPVARAAGSADHISLPVIIGHDLEFTALTSTEGLPSDDVRGIAQDQQGFLWFATANGLSRYDGYSFRTFRYERGRANTLTGNEISTIIAGRDGVLWLAVTGEGVDRFDPATETFTNYRHEPGNPNSLSGNMSYPRGLVEDRQGNLWIGTTHKGLDRLDPRSGQFRHYRRDPWNANSLSSNEIAAVFQDRRGIMWIGTANSGLNSFDPATGRVTRYPTSASDPHVLPPATVQAVFEDRAGTLWVGTEKGMGSLDRRTGRFTRYVIGSDLPAPEIAALNAVVDFHEDMAGNLWLGTNGAGVLRLDRSAGRAVWYGKDPGARHGLRSNTITTLFEERSGTLWVNTTGGGAHKISTRPAKFAHYLHQPNNPDSVAGNVILSIFEDHTGTVWIGNNNTLNRWDRRTNRWRTYRNDPANPASISDGSVTSIQEDPDGTLWFGTFFGGLNRFDPRTGVFTSYRSDAADPRSLSDDIVRSVYRDSRGTLWVGGWNNGLNRFDRATGTFQRFSYDPSAPASLSSGSVSDILEDRHKTLWIATDGGGLNRFDRATGTFRQYQNDPHDVRTLPSNAVRVIHEDRTGQLWVGTTGGLCAFDRTTGTCSAVYTEREGMANDTVAGILEDDRGNLWISTNNGLSRFTPQTRAFHNFDVVDGVQGREFNRFAAFYRSARTGEMYFGGNNGFNVFDPARVTDNPFVPPVALVDFRLFNKPVRVGPDSILKRTIDGVAGLTLRYDQNSITFEFSALSYVAPEKNCYRYRLVDFDAGWHEADSTERFATYTNLDPGHYVLQVQGTNEDGIWNREGVSLPITITPPWWTTWWFRGLAALTLLVLAVSSYRLRVRSLRQRTERLEREVALRTADLETANRDLEAFSYSASHDLRAPLRHIRGFTEMLQEESAADLDDDGRYRLSAIATSAERMGKLIDDLLSFSRLGRKEMVTSNVDLNELVREIVAECGPDTENRNILWKVSSLPVVLGDHGLLRAAFANLVSNAVKFTSRQEEATIEIGERAVDGEIVVYVKDDGVGFDMKYADKIFDVFERLHRQDDFHGTGIGLANVRRIVDRHGGRIWAEGEVGRGAVFYLCLPAAARTETPARAQGALPLQRGLPHEDSSRDRS